MGRRIQGFYTVEAAAVFSICFLLMGSAILLGYEVYHETLIQAGESPVSVDSLGLFRIAEMAEEVLGLE